MQARSKAIANGADCWCKVPDVRSLDWRSHDEHGTGLMRGAVVTQAPVRAGSNNAMRTFNRSESKQREHVALHATKRIKRAELNVPKRRVRAVLLHTIDASSHRCQIFYIKF